MKQNRDGFTIVELLVTIVVSGLIISAIFALLTTIQAAQRSAILTTVATRAGESKIESLRNLNYTALDLGETTFTEELPTELKDSRGVFTVSEETDGVRRVDLTITYRDRSKEKTVQLSTLIGQLGIGK